MNYVQFGLFIFIFFSILFCGIAIYRLLAGNNSSLNRGIYLGETLLLGSILLVGEFLALSLFSLYKLPFLAAIVALNYLLFFNKDVKGGFVSLFKHPHFDLFNTVFILLISVLIFRNMYFLVDVDSASTYLFTQKVWLLKGTSIIGSNAIDMRIFAPQFDTIFYSLGLVFTNFEILFPQLINIFWKIIVLLLVYGYTSYRFNGLCGLGATMLVLFDMHFFFSGANQWVMLNCALVAFIFAAAYNFWEARRSNDIFRFALALIFLAQLPANKYQMAYIFIFFLGAGVLIQPQPLEKIKEVLTSKKLALGIAGSIFCACLWYVKNWIAVGLPTFPIFAGNLNVGGWTPEQSDIFIKFFTGISPMLFFKYMTYFFIWPGIVSSKIVIIFISLLPIVLLLFLNSAKKDKEPLMELSFWLGIAILSVMGICLACHQDPRYYRFPIGIFSFAAIFSIAFIIGQFFKANRNLLTGIIAICIGLLGYPIIYSEGGSFSRPTFQENLAVLRDQIHTDYAIKKHYPIAFSVAIAIEKNKRKAENAGWGLRDSLNFPTFYLPVRPMVSLWLTTVIRWDSYANETSIIEDLKKAGLEWIMELRGNDLLFLSREEYAKEAAAYNRRPEKVSYDYGFPEELSHIKYGD